MESKVISPQHVPGYTMPTMVYFGRGSLAALAELKLGNRVVLVCGRHFRDSAFFQLVTNVYLSNVLVYPTDVRQSNADSINRLIDFCRQAGCDGIVAIGGGTVMDSAKCAAALTNAGGYIEAYLSGNQSVTQPGVPLIAVPTTAGTGSEVTPWATVWGAAKKYSLAASTMFPSLAIVDPALTDSLSPITTAHAGCDALVQAVEAYWSINHNPVSDQYALEAIPTIMRHLEPAAGGLDITARDGMMWGALMSGLAFSNTQTTICHAVSYPLSARWQVAHGQAVVVTLPLFIEYVVPALPPDRQRSLLQAFGANNIPELANLVRNLIHRLGLVSKLSELGITADDLGTIATEALTAERANNTPRVPTISELETLLISAL